MKTILKLALASLLFLVLLSCQKDKDILPANARLKQVLLYDSINAKDPYGIEEEYEYNESGQISKVLYSNYGDRFNKYHLYEYNSAGQLVQIKEYYGDSPSGITYTYTYSSEGKKVKESVQYWSRSGYNLFFYTDGRLSRIESYGWPQSTDQLFESRIFEFDDYGQSIREVLYGFNNEPYEWTINTFSNGLMVKTEIYVDETLQNNRRKIYRTFDANKNLKIKETYEGRASSGVGHRICKYIYFGE